MGMENLFQETSLYSCQMGCHNLWVGRTDLGHGEKLNCFATMDMGKHS